jgi:hypothetical protein
MDIKEHYSKALQYENKKEIPELSIFEPGAKKTKQDKQKQKIGLIL